MKGIRYNTDLTMNTWVGYISLLIESIRTVLLTFLLERLNEPNLY